MIYDTSKLYCNVFFKYNGIIPQEIYEEVTLTGKSRLDDMNCYHIIRNYKNRIFFDYVEYRKNKNFLRNLKLNRLLGIKDNNSVSDDLISFFETFTNEIKDIQIN